jgi:hypothetical protein
MAATETVKTVMLSAKSWAVSLVCLGTTKDGHPKHPLCVRADQPFVPFGDPPFFRGSRKEGLRAPT